MKTSIEVLTFSLCSQENGTLGIDSVEYKQGGIDFVY